ncbi:VOC family protein [Kribbella pittospori]|uniref:VOC family protein n=1 Tax=Kribbella pittospori TaxID=722689 RepID=A0A4R0KP31_9ACTN|nr:VOC family protein [Kribbella pittospori]TCC62119.1 VOC family protein [Kribbella pittospori]
MVDAPGGSPIHNRIGAVFVHVTDMQRAIDWYGDLLGVPRQQASHEGLIYDVPMDGPTGLTLDGHAHARGTFRPGEPLLMLHADDIQAAHSFAVEHATEVGAVEDIGSVSVFHLADPDGNKLIVYAEN